MSLKEKSVSNCIDVASFKICKKIVFGFEVCFLVLIRKLTDKEWQAEHKFLNVFSPAAAFPEAFFFFAGILLNN